MMGAWPRDSNRRRKGRVPADRPATMQRCCRRTAVPDPVDLFVWVGMTVLAIVFATLGPPKFLQYGTFVQRGHAAWARDLGPQRTRLIGVLETLGALGLILPLAFGRFTWISVLAGVGLMLLMLAASLLHTRRGETRQTGVTVLLGLLALLVTVGLVL